MQHLTLKYYMRAIYFLLQSLLLPEGTERFARKQVRLSQPLSLSRINSN